MRVKLNWLNELVDLSGLTTKEIVNTLSLHSIEIESVCQVIKGSNLTIGHVLECENHPDSDHLHICKVDVGTEVLQIVCGAPNIKKDMYVIVALINCELPGNFKIKKSKIRGVESSGMICSLQELGMEKKFIPEEYLEGIYYFTKEVKAGDNPLEKLDFDDDILELGLTPNRNDLLSMMGVAYEASAVFNRPMKPLVYKLLENGDENKANVEVKLDTDKCITYYAKVIKDVKIKKSPDWLISRLIAFDIRPINNAVDITNYILALFGQPLHAFDKDKLNGKIVVRNAYDNEKMITLDGIERALLKDDIVITDGKKPIALAGVMGGLDSGISESTKDIILEAAAFDPISVRRTYTRLNLRSESAIRFEKGLDINNIKEALNYASYLFETLCEAKICSGDVFQGLEKANEVKVKISSEYISNYLGVQIDDKEIKEILSRLKFPVTSDLIVTVPTRRCDVKIKADIVEEIGRVYGYYRLPSTLPQTNLAGGLNEYQIKRRLLRHTLAGIGLTEVINYTLRENNNEFTYMHDKGSTDIELILPISSERKILRRSITPSVLDNVIYSFNRKIKNVAYFELGKVYYKKDEKNIEEEHLAIAMANNFSSTLWKQDIENVDFYVIKGILDYVMDTFKCQLTYKKLEGEFIEMHPLRTATLYFENEIVGYVGEVHPKYSLTKEIDNVYVSEINISKILSKKNEISMFVPVTKVPNIERDLALVVNKNKPAQDLVETIKNVDRKMISDVIIFDLYVGEKIDKECKSIAIRIVFTGTDTLTDEIVNNKINKILKILEKEHNAILRS